MNTPSENMVEILKSVLSEDRTRLGRPDEMIAELEKRVPGALARQANPIKTALQKQMGEMLILADEDATHRENLRRDIIERLTRDSMRQETAEKVAEELIQAMGWDETDPSSPTQSPKEMPPSPSPQASQISPWVCTCGVENTGNFCTACGAGKSNPPPLARSVAEPVPETPRNAPAVPAPSPSTVQSPTVLPTEGTPKTSQGASPVLMALCLLLLAVVVFFGVKNLRGFVIGIVLYHSCLHVKKNGARCQSARSSTLSQQ